MTVITSCSEVRSQVGYVERMFGGTEPTTEKSWYPVWETWEDYSPFYGDLKASGPWRYGMTKHKL